MFSRNYFLLAVIAITIMVTSCGKKAPTQAKYIPKDASLVLVFNPATLEAKLKEGKLSYDSIANVFADEFNADSAAKNEWNEFKESGINLNDNLYFFQQQKGGSLTNPSSTFCLMASIKDASKFDTYIQTKAKKDNKTISKETNCSYVKLDGNNAVTWNKDVVMLTVYTPSYKASFDSVGNYVMPNEEENAKQLKEMALSYYSLKEVEQVTSVDVFNNMFKEKADMYMFGGTGSTLAMLSATPLNIPKLQELLKDNYSASTLNFDKGKIVATSVSHTNPILSSILKKYAGPTVNTSFMEGFPSQNVNGFILASFNPELFDGLLKELEVKGMLEGVLAQQGLTSADIFKSIKGDINVGMADFTLASKEVSYPMGNGKNYTYTTEVPSAKLIVSAPIADKNAFEKLMNKAAENNLVVKRGEAYVGGDLVKSSGLFILATAKELVIASDSATYAAYTAGGSKSNISSNIVSELKGKSTGGYFNIASILNGLTPTIKDEMGKKVLAALQATFKEAVFTSDNFNDGKVSSNMYVSMANDKENSAVSIARLIINIYNTIKEQKKNAIPAEGYPLSDSTTVPTK